MNYLLVILSLLLLLSCGTSNAIDDISGASFGTKNHRIQFHINNGNYMKFSPNVLGYDDVSGPTFKKVSVASNTITYKSVSSEDTVLVTVVNNEKVIAILNDTDEEKFTPRGVNLGKRPE